MTISRRNAIMGMASLPLISTVAAAEVQCVNNNDGYTQRCFIGQRHSTVKTSLQRCNVWCWAACVEGIVNSKGYNISQESIVKRMYGNLHCQPAQSGQQIVNLINSGRWRDDDGRKFDIYAQTLINVETGYFRRDVHPVKSLLNNFANGNHGIIGYKNHVVMAAGIWGTQTQSGFNTTFLEVRDPWPDSQHARVLNYDEIVGTKLLMNVRVE